MPRSRLAVSLSVLVVVALAPTPARACLCSPPVYGRAALARSAAIFEGTVISVTKEPVYVRARVKVGRRWKGPDVPELDVATASPFGGCGHDLQVGQTWLFYTQADCNLLVSSSCTASRLISEANVDLADLGPPLAAGVEIPDGGAGSGKLNDAGVCGPDLAVAPDLTVSPPLANHGCAIGRAPSETSAPILWLIALALGVSRGLRASGCARRPRR